MKKQEIDWVARKFLQLVEDGTTRSKILRVATVLSIGDDDPEDAYWSLVGFYMYPENRDDLDEVYNEITLADALEAVEED